MFGRLETRRRRAEQIAEQAWDHLTEAVESAEESIRRQHGGTSKRITTGTREARRRAAVAYEALTGRRRRTPWEWFAAATLVGAAAGWVVTAVTHRVRDGSDPMTLPESFVEEFTHSSRS